MSECINITATENLPLETTLLIHYTITCSGYWDLDQNITAYRNVCNDYWTIMYANIQHPLHTDFPISVGASSVSATYAWNYGGTLGISAENFDPNHSYLTQIGIFNRDCGLTGTQTGIVSSGVNTSGNYNPSEPVDLNDGDPTIPPSSRPIPGGGDPPGPGIPSWGDVDNQPRSPGGDNPSMPGRDRQPGEYPTAPPVTGNNPQELSGFGVQVDSFTALISAAKPVVSGLSSGDPQSPLINSDGNTSFISVRPDAIISSVNSLFKTNQSNQDSSISLPSNTVNTNTVGTDWVTAVINSEAKRVNLPSVIEISTDVLGQVSYPTVKRPSEFGVGVEGQSTSTHSITERSAAFSSLPGIAPSSLNQSDKFDLSSNSEDYTADAPGLMSRLKFDTPLVKDEKSQETMYLDTSSVIASSKTLLNLPQDDIIKGETVFIAGSYSVPNGVVLDCTLELWLIDSQNRNNKLISATKTVSENNSGNITYTCNTYQTSTGKNIVILMVKDSSGRIVGIASKKFIVRPTSLSNLSDNRIQTQINKVQEGTLPYSIVDLVNIEDDPIKVYTKNNKSYNFLLRKKPGSNNNIAAIALVHGESTSTYGMTIYDNIVSIPSNNDSDEGQSEISTLNRLKDGIGKVLARSTDRIKLDGEELLPQSHTVGIGRTNTSESNLVLSIGPATSTLENKNKVISIYLGASYEPQPIETTVVYTEVTGSGSAVISAQTPYVSIPLGLVVNGPVENGLSDNYTIAYANTNISGHCVWSGVVITKGYYYSIIEPRYDIYNPYKGIVYSSKI